jgi:hypothetical protein
MADDSGDKAYGKIRIVPRPPYKRQLVEEALGKPVPEYVQALLDSGSSLTDVAWQISETTRIRVSVENLRDWLGRNAPPAEPGPG